MNLPIHKKLACFSKTGEFLFVFVLFIGFSLYPELHGALEILKIILVTAHSLADIVGELRNGTSVDVL